MYIQNMKLHLNLCSQMCWLQTYWCLSADTKILPSRAFQVFFNNKKYRSEQEKDFGQYIYTYKYHPPIGWFEKTYNHMASYTIIEMFEQLHKFRWKATKLLIILCCFMLRYLRCLVLYFWYIHWILITGNVFFL